MLTLCDHYLSLVFDRGDSSKVPPVNVFRKVVNISRRQILGAPHGCVGPCVVELGAGLVAVDHRGELVVEQVAELVHGQVVALVAFDGQVVVPLDLGFVVHPDFHPRQQGANLRNQINQSSLYHFYM